MKLAEALQQRADLARRLGRLSNSITSNTLYQEGSEPSEDITKLIEEYNDSSNELRDLVYKINMVNNSTFIDDHNITYYIAERDNLKSKLSLYNKLSYTAGTIGFRSRAAEIKTLSAVDSKEIRKIIDDLSKQLREIDNLIQKTNWSTDID